MNFKYYGKIDVSNIKEKLSKLDWDSWKYRQKMSEGVHIHTKSVPIIFDEERKQAVYREEYELFKDDLEVISEIFKKQIGDGYLFNALLINLPAGKAIKTHTDVHESFEISHRIHIPIITNDKCFFSVDIETKNLKEGELWEINNTEKVHGVINDGDEDRIHLLVDWISVKKEKSLL